MTNLKSQVLSIVDDLENPRTVTSEDPTFYTEDAGWYYDDDKEMWFDDEGEPRDDDEVTTMSAYDYLGSEALDIEYIVNSKREFIGARILVTCGGPNIWIDTQHDTVEGHWWGESHTEHFNDEMGLHYACEELWEMTA